MTALQEYQRLETFGIWHASPRDQRRDVIVQLGEATLTISDPNMMALSHWSLPAVLRLNPGERPACFGPGPDMPEVLELEDETMISAIEKVRTAIEKRRPRPNRLRRAITLALVAVVAGAAGFWLPGALVRQAVAVVPSVKRAELGDALLSDIRRVAGSPCEGALGRRALDRLRLRLLPESTGRLVVVGGGVAASEHLPGGIILLNRALVENYDDPAVVAGHILAQDESARRNDPLRDLLFGTGVWSTIRLLSTGGLSSDALDGYAERLLETPSPRPPDEALIRRFTEARVPSTPYARALDPSGETTLGLIEADPIPPGGARPVLADSDWISLQSICTD